jgi:hypothetical protein
VTTDQPHSNTIVLDFEELPTEVAVRANLAGKNPKLGDIVAINVDGAEVSSGIVIEGDGDAPFDLRFTDSLAEG